MARPIIIDLTPGDRQHELVATTALLRGRGLASHKIASALDHLGSAVTLARHVLGEEPLPSSLYEDWVGRISADELELSARDVEGWRDRGLVMVTVLDPEYPQQLHEVFNRPPLLFVKGQLRAEDWRSVAVVGTRTASPEGLLRAQRLTRELASEGLTIVSGLAAGIDTAAHETALRHAARTVAVMGTGIECHFPPENAGLAARIVESGGALLTQFFPDQGPKKWTFPMRNAVMSGFAMATVVVEAGPTSGARTQARLALEHGRAVFFLESLVDAYPWAREYAEDGRFGTRAIVVSSTDEMIERLVGTLEPATSLAV